MAYKKKSNRTSKPKKKYSAAERRAYNIGVGVAVGRHFGTPQELTSHFASSSTRRAYYDGFVKGSDKAFNLYGYSMMKK